MKQHRSGRGSGRVAFAESLHKAGVNPSSTYGPKNLPGSSKSALSGPGPLAGTFSDKPERPASPRSREIILATCTNYQDTGSYLGLEVLLDIRDLLSEIKLKL